MFDYNSLFNKVFATTDGLFDPDNYFLTVLVNTVGDAEYYPSFDSQRRMHMGDSYYIEIPVFDSPDVDAFRTRIMTMGQEYAVKVNSAYVYLMDFVKNGYNEALAKDYLQIVREYKKPGDTLALVAVLPDDLSGVKNLLASLENEVRSDEILYIYNKQPYREKVLGDGLCGVVLLHSSKELYSKLRRDEQACNQTLNSALAGLPTQGADAIRAKNPVFWSSLGCTFSNPKMDHLRNYVALLCDKAKTFSEEDYTKLCGELYTGMAEDKNKSGMRDLLLQTVDRIPRVEKQPPKYDGYTLKDYFGCLFGSDGVKTVELSFKVTLSMMPSAINDAVVSNVARALFERAAGYHSVDLFGDVCRFLDTYCSAFDREFSGARQKMMNYVEQNADNDSYAEDLEHYVSDYIKYYDLQKCCEFWAEVCNYVKNHKEVFAEACAKASNLNNELIRIKRELQIRKAVSTDPDAVRSYPASAIFDACNNQALCSEIAAMYKEPENAGKDAGDVDMSHLLSLNSTPGFSTLVQNEIVTGNGGYTTFIKQIIGKYLHFNIREVANV